MKKILLIAIMMYSSLFAAINGHSEQLFISESKKKLKIPYRIDNVSSLVDMYLSYEETKTNGKNIVIMYIIDGGSKFDKEELKQAYNKDFKNMVCNNSINEVFGDDKKNTISFKIMFKGEESFVLSYVNEDCKQYYSEKLQKKKKLAEQGDSKAQYELALMYYKGEEVQKDLNKAVEWSKKSEDQGNIDAMMLTTAIFAEMLGNIVNNSQDKEVAKKFEEAEKLAKKGKVTDQYNLGQLYYKEKNIKEALYWFEQAANQGYAKAQYNLGVIYDKQKDTQKSFYWTEKAANQGLSIAQFNLGLAYLDTKNKSENPEKAFYWMEKAANQGDLDAMNYLGLMYKKGYGVDQNYTKASEWYKKACDNGNSNGCKNYKELVN